jgi:cytoskeletal protein CcmA (bactofilin family)
MGGAQKETEKMWKRDQEALPDNSEPEAPAPPSPSTSMRPPAVSAANVRENRSPVPIGRSVVMKGELSASEDLAVEGTVEGTIELRENVLTIGPNGRIKAQIFAKTVIVFGSVNGNITASDRVDIRDAGAVDGNIVSPRVSIADGAHFRGSVDMQKKSPQLVKPSAHNVTSGDKSVHAAGVAH